MQTLKKIPGMALGSETRRGSFYVSTVEQPNPGSFVMKKCNKCKRILFKTVDFFYFDKKTNCYSGYCKKCNIRRAKKWRIENIERAKENNKKWNQNNILKKRKYNNKYHKKKWENIGYRLNMSISASVNYSLKNNKNGYHWEALVNYTQQDLRKHLEKQFKDGMNWNNYGKWQIDHIIPKSFFDIKKIKDNEFKKCWTLDNLQPLWEKDNLKKYNKI